MIDRKKSSKTMTGDFGVLWATSNFAFQVNRRVFEAFEEVTLVKDIFIEIRQNVDAGYTTY